MKVGRKTKEQRAVMIKSFLLFVFLFKAVPSDILDLFAKVFWGLKNSSKWRLTMQKNGYLKSIPLSWALLGIRNNGVGNSVVFLTKKGVEFLANFESVKEYLEGYPLDRYRYQPYMFKVQLLQHNMSVMRAFVHLQSRDLNGRWQSEWCARGLLCEGNKGKLTGMRIRLPDGVFTVSSGVRVAVECEQSLKNMRDSKRMMEDWENDLVVTKRKDLLKKEDFIGSAYDRVLVVCGSDTLAKRIGERMESRIQVNREKYLVTTFEGLKNGVGIAFGAKVQIDGFFGIGEKMNGEHSV